jgi:hypothetical protein
MIRCREGARSPKQISKTVFPRSSYTYVYFSFVVDYFPRIGQYCFYFGLLRN